MNFFVKLFVVVCCLLPQFVLKVTSTCEHGKFYPDSHKCDAYYRCNWGQMMKFQCPGGLHWNNQILTCDWPSGVKCSHQIPNSQPLPVTPTSWVPSPSRPSQFTPQFIPQVPNRPHSPTTTSTSGNSQFKVVCYYTNWSWYRSGMAKYQPQDVDTNLCTHIVYAFAVLNAGQLVIQVHDPLIDLDNELYKEVTAMKSKGVKILIAIGGWNDSAGDKYSRLVNNPAARRNFVAHVTNFIQQHNFDGLDLDWEYPKCWQVNCNSGPQSDKQGFTALVAELSAAFKPKGYLLSAAVSPSKTVIDAGYDVPSLNRHLDWIAVMIYDFHGHWDKETGHVAPLYYYPGDKLDYFNSDFAVRYWMEKGASPGKLIMGMPLYGQSFTLADTTDNGLNAKAHGPGESGEFTKNGGTLAFYEVCVRVKRKLWSVKRDPQGRMGPYTVLGNQWASYDDMADIRRKSKLIKQLGLGGGMVWSLDFDDFMNTCGCGKYPLLKTMNKELRGIAVGSNLENCT